MPAFRIEASDNATRARAGILTTPHGPVETPAFMPVATWGAVRALTQADLKELGVKALLANAYHLYLRPGAEIISEAGGLHGFMNYPGCLLTDSGGFQVMSLAPLCKVEPEGVIFKSHLDGSLHTWTPESVIDIQDRLGSDIWTSLDECLRYPCTEVQARLALERTMGWTESASGAVRRRNRGALFFPILQGSLFPRLREVAAEHLSTIAHDGIALGGFSVGEPKSLTWEILERTTSFLPRETPRYLMGVGTPEDLWEAVSLGADMMDCVWPTRVARHGQAMLRSGSLNLASASCRPDHGPLDPDCSCRTCRSHSRAYLSHLVRSQDPTAMRLLSLHNLHFLAELMRTIRRAILDGDFVETRADFLRSRQAASVGQDPSCCAGPTAA